MNPDPIRLLGAGRVDPFLSYPGEATNPSTHELMDHGEALFSVPSLTLVPMLIFNDAPDSYHLSFAWTRSGR